MSFFKAKPSLPTPALQVLRPDLNQAVLATPQKVSRSLLATPAVLNYLNERLPVDETVQDIVSCGGTIDEYLADIHWSGGLVLTDKRLVVARTREGASGITVLAWPFAELSSVSFQPHNVRGVTGGAVFIEYGHGTQLELSVDGDTSHAAAFFQAVQARLNNSGRYSL